MPKEIDRHQLRTYPPAQPRLKGAKVNLLGLVGLLPSCVCPAKGSISSGWKIRRGNGQEAP